MLIGVVVVFLWRAAFFSFCRWTSLSIFWCCSCALFFWKEDTFVLLIYYLLCQQHQRLLLMCSPSCASSASSFRDCIFRIMTPFSLLGSSDVLWQNFLGSFVMLLLAVVVCLLCLWWRVLTTPSIFRMKLWTGEAQVCFVLFLLFVSVFVLFCFVLFCFVLFCFVFFFFLEKKVKNHSMFIFEVFFTGSWGLATVTVRMPSFEEALIASCCVPLGSWIEREKLPYRLSTRCHFFSFSSFFSSWCPEMVRTSSCSCTSIASLGTPASSQSMVIALLSSDTLIRGIKESEPDCSRSHLAPCCTRGKSPKSQSNGCTYSRFLDEATALVFLLTLLLLLVVALMKCEWKEKSI